MTYDDKITWLRRYRAARRKEKLLEARVQSARERALSLSQSLRPISVQTNNIANVVEEAAVKADELQQALARQVMETFAIQYEIEDALSLLDEREAAVLQMRYIELNDYNTIADALGFVTRRVYQLHRAGVEHLHIEPDASA